MRARPHLTFELLQLYSFVSRMLVDAQNSTRPCAQNYKLAPRLRRGEYKQMAIFTLKWRGSESARYFFTKTY